ncbi:uncharacterized protein LOC101846067 [Aplysia californica]|uniref:Uncharacterized protein LOC101846067 n=1 Tax=Aplysia californica TaxID=6500 RepID=A0ABM0JKS7_APLCA|nr:uncharacterized protein LOC101846067 [Aplysia californica]XP_012936613.1 uncharacterized protein LOC101846067 [Aplysia californica]
MGALHSTVTGEEQDFRPRNESTVGANGQSNTRGHYVFQMPKRTHETTRKDFEYLIGKLEHLPASTQKLFSLGKLYLRAGLCQDVRGDGDQTVRPVEEQTVPGITHTYRLGLEAEGASGDETSQISTQVEENSLSRHERYSSDSTRPNESDLGLFTPFVMSTPLYHMQTFTRWKVAYSLNNLYPFCYRKRRTTIYIQPLEDFPDFFSSYRVQVGKLTLDFFQLLQSFVQIYFSGFESLVLSPVSLSSMDGQVRSREHEVTSQKQYCVNDLHPLMQQLLPPDGLSVVGILWTDIYPEGYNFVLGEASATHRSAVISFGRFETKGYDLATHQDISEVNGALLWKLFKTLSHETCHLLGLDHCQFFHCAMNESGSVSEAMEQPLFLCPVCLRKLQQASQFDLLERYQQLRQFLSAVFAQHDDSDRLRLSLDWLNSCIHYMTSL